MAPLTPCMYSGATLCASPSKLPRGFVSKQIQSSLPDVGTRPSSCRHRFWPELPLLLAGQAAAWLNALAADGPLHCHQQLPMLGLVAQDAFISAKFCCTLRSLLQAAT